MKVPKNSALFFCTFLLSVLLMSVAVMAAPVEAEDYRLMLNGREVAFSAETPTIINDGRTLLPLRSLFDIINEDGTGTVDWDESKAQITLVYGETEAKLWIGEATAEINGVKTPIDGTAPMIYNGRVYVPLRFVADVFDMTTNWNGTSKTAFAMNNQKLDQIISIWKGSNEFAKDSKIYAEISVNASMVMNTDGESQAIDVEAEGIIEQDYAGKFQHMIMNTSTMGTEITVETYDDGESMYMIVNDEVMKSASALAIADSAALSQYDVTAGLDISRELYASFNLEEEGGNYIISGDLYLPEEYFGELLSSMQGLGDISELLSGTQIKISDPIQYKMVVSQETGALLSMDMHYALEMTMSVMDEELSMAIKYDVSMPKFETNAQFDTLVPEEIIAKAAA